MKTNLFVAFKAFILNFHLSKKPPNYSTRAADRDELKPVYRPSMNLVCEGFRMKRGVKSLIETGFLTVTIFS